MKRMKLSAICALRAVCAFIISLVFNDNTAFAQTGKAEKHLTSSQALEGLFARVEKETIEAAEAMPADKYGFTPTDGEFKGVRTFGEQVKHLSATNYILSAAALGVNPPPDAGDEKGPDTVRTKAEVISYLKNSFAYLHRAMLLIDSNNMVTTGSPISPLTHGNATRLGLVVESLIHAANHYGQMVEYLRMNLVIPPASR
jgi:hypothetical protein